MAARCENGGDEEELGPSTLRRVHLTQIMDGRCDRAMMAAMAAIRAPCACLLRRAGQNQHQALAPRHDAHGLKQAAPFGHRRCIMPEDNPRTARQRVNGRQ